MMYKEIREFLMNLILIIGVIVLCFSFYSAGIMKAKVEMIEQISEQIIEEYNVSVEVNEDAENQR